MEEKRSDILCKECGVLWSSDCKSCNPDRPPLDPELLKDLIACIKPYWKERNVIWLDVRKKDKEELDE